MVCSATVANALCAISLLGTALGAPTPQAGSGKPINNDDVPGIPIGPPGSSGSIYGPDTLLGNDGNPVDPSDSAIVTDYELVTGQEANADIGFYLDFNKTPNPQPLRGSNGATDPGPRESSKGQCEVQLLIETQVLSIMTVSTVTWSLDPAPIAGTFPTPNGLWVYLLAGLVQVKILDGHDNKIPTSFQLRPKWLV